MSTLQAGPEQPAAALRLHLAAALRQRAPAPLICSLARALSPAGTLCPAAQQALLRLAPPPVPLLPPDAEHLRRVLRAAVLAAEADGEEVCEQLYALYSACLLGQPLGCCGQDASSSGSSGAAVALLPPPPQPGFCYKLWSYGPAGEPADATLQRLAALEQRVAQQRQVYGQQQQQGGCEPSLQPPPAAAGDARHGLLALHVSLALSEGGTGCHEWEAGFLLAEWVLSRPQLVAGRCCLEVGCGAGMVAVALHRAGAAAVIATDGDAAAVANCRFNLRLNGAPLLDDGAESACSDFDVCSGSSQQQQEQQQEQQQQQRGASCRQLCWEDGWAPEAGAQRQRQQPTLVLGADLLYDPTVIPTLLALLKQVLAAAAPPGSPAAAAADEAAAAAGAAAPAAYLATTLRNEATLQQFLAAAEADPAVCIEHLEGPGMPAAAAGAAADGGSGGSGNAGSCSDALATASAAESAPIRFHHLAELEAARSRIFLHRITLQPC